MMCREPSGVKSPKGNRAFLSCLSFLREDEKARPTNLTNFSEVYQAFDVHKR
jgi:hypothetical protein